MMEFSFGKNCFLKSNAHRHMLDIFVRTVRWRRGNEQLDLYHMAFHSWRTMIQDSTSGNTVDHFKNQTNFKSP